MILINSDTKLNHTINYAMLNNNRDDGIVKCIENQIPISTMFNAINLSVNF